MLTNQKTIIEPLNQTIINIRENVDPCTELAATVKIILHQKLPSDAHQPKKLFTIIKLSNQPIINQLFDLTATNIVGKYPGKSGLNMLLHLVSKVF